MVNSINCCDVSLKIVDKSETDFAIRSNNKLSESVALLLFQTS